MSLICRWTEDGSLVDDGSGSYTNWREGQPTGEEDWNCMVMDPVDGTWGDYDCDDDSGPAVCSKPIASAAAAAAAHNITRT